MLEAEKKRKERLKAKIREIQEQKKELRTERQEQPAFLTAFKTRWPGVLIFSSGNGASGGGKREKSKMKTQGLVSGVPDLFIPEWFTFIELKQKKSGKASEEQNEMMEKLTKMGYVCLVSHGADEAMRQCEEIYRKLQSAANGL